METGSDLDSKPYRYIVLCKTFSTGLDSDSDPCMDSFPNGYCTHFRDGSPSQLQFSISILYIWIWGSESESKPVEKYICIVQESESESVSVGGNEPLGRHHTIYKVKSLAYFNEYAYVMPFRLFSYTLR